MARRYSLALLLLFLVAVASAFSQRAVQDPGALARFQSALQQNGFEVTPGAVARFDPAALWCSGDPSFESAMYFSNEPYLVMEVPQSGLLTPDFQVRADEAIVVVGLTPPPAKYFSITPYLDWKVYPDGSRKRVAATFGDSVNNATVHTTGSVPFNSPVALIFTSDQEIDASVREALRRAGYPPAIMNTVVLPASMLNLGQGQNADQFLITMRMAIWTDPNEGASYISNPPLSVFRVTRHNTADGKPFPVPNLRVRGTGQTEMGLSKKLDELRAGIIEGNPGLHAIDITPRPLCNEGNDLIQRGVLLCGDSRDSLYLAAGFILWPDPSDFTLADDEFLMIYGVNHVATGKATYMNVNIYAGADAHITVGHVDDRQFKDTASRYLPGGDPAANLMYAYKVSRHCGENEPQCLQLSAREDCPRFTLDSSTLLGVFTRIYLEPGTKIGPAMPEILYDRVIKFSPR